MATEFMEAKRGKLSITSSLMLDTYPLDLVIRDSDTPNSFPNF